MKQYCTSADCSTTPSVIDVLTTLRNAWPLAERNKGKQLRPNQVTTLLLLGYHRELESGLQKALQAKPDEDRSWKAVFATRVSGAHIVQLPTGQGKGDILGLLAAFRFLFYGECSILVAPTIQLRGDVWERTSALLANLEIERNVYHEITDENYLTKGASTAHTDARHSDPGAAAADTAAKRTVGGGRPSDADTEVTPETLCIAVLTDTTLMAGHLANQQGTFSEQVTQVMPWLGDVPPPASRACTTDDDAADAGAGASGAAVDSASSSTSGASSASTSSPTTSGITSKWALFVDEADALLFRATGMRSQVDFPDREAVMTTALLYYYFRKLNRKQAADPEGRQEDDLFAATFLSTAPPALAHGNVEEQAGSQPKLSASDVQSLFSVRAWRWLASDDANGSKKDREAAAEVKGIAKAVQQEILMARFGKKTGAADSLGLQSWVDSDEHFQGNDKPKIKKFLDTGLYRAIALPLCGPRAEQHEQCVKHSASWEDMRKLLQQRGVCDDALPPGDEPQCNAEKIFQLLRIALGTERVLETVMQRAVFSTQPPEVAQAQLGPWSASQKLLPLLQFRALTGGRTAAWNTRAQILQHNLRAQLPAMREDYDLASDMRNNKDYVYGADTGGIRICDLVQGAETSSKWTWMRGSSAPDWVKGLAAYYNSRREMEKLSFDWLQAEVEVVWREEEKRKTPSKAETVDVEEEKVKRAKVLEERAKVLEELHKKTMASEGDFAAKASSWGAVKKPKEAPDEAAQAVQEVLSDLSVCGKPKPPGGSDVDIDIVQCLDLLNAHFGCSGTDFAPGVAGAALIFEKGQADTVRPTDEVAASRKIAIATTRLQTLLSRMKENLQKAIEKYENMILKTGTILGPHALWAAKVAAGEDESRSFNGVDLITPKNKMQTIASADFKLKLLKGVADKLKASGLLLMSSATADSAHAGFAPGAFTLVDGKPAEQMIYSGFTHFFLETRELPGEAPHQPGPVSLDVFSFFAAISRTTAGIGGGLFGFTGTLPRQQKEKELFVALTGRLFGGGGAALSTVPAAMPSRLEFVSAHDLFDDSRSNCRNEGKQLQDTMKQIVGLSKQGSQIGGVGVARQSATAARWAQVVSLLLWRNKGTLFAHLHPKDEPEKQKEQCFNPTEFCFLVILTSRHDMQRFERLMKKAGELADHDENPAEMSPAGTFALNSEADVAAKKYKAGDVVLAVAGIGGRGTDWDCDAPGGWVLADLAKVKNERERDQISGRVARSGKPGAKLKFEDESSSRASSISSSSTKSERELFGMKHDLSEYFESDLMSRILLPLVRFAAEQRPQILPYFVTRPFYKDLRTHVREFLQKTAEELKLLENAGGGGSSAGAGGSGQKRGMTWSRNTLREWLKSMGISLLELAKRGLSRFFGTIAARFFGSIGIEQIDAAVKRETELIRIRREVFKDFLALRDALVHEIMMDTVTTSPAPRETPIKSAPDEGEAAWSDERNAELLTQRAGVYGAQLFTPLEDRGPGHQPKLSGSAEGGHGTQFLAPSAEEKTAPRPYHLAVPVADKLYYQSPLPKAARGRVLDQAEWNALELFLREKQQLSNYMLYKTLREVLPVAVPDGDEEFSSQVPGGGQTQIKPENEEVAGTLAAAAKSKNDEHLSQFGQMALLWDELQTDREQRAKSAMSASSSRSSGTKQQEGQGAASTDIFPDDGDDERAVRKPGRATADKNIVVTQQQDKDLDEDQDQDMDADRNQNLNRNLDAHHDAGCTPGEYICPWYDKPYEEKAGQGPGNANDGADVRGLKLFEHFKSSAPEKVQVMSMPAGQRFAPGGSSFDEKGQDWKEATDLFGDQEKFEKKSGQTGVQTVEDWRKSKTDGGGGGASETSVQDEAGRTPTDEATRSIRAAGLARKVQSTSEDTRVFALRRPSEYFYPKCVRRPETAPSKTPSREPPAVNLRVLLDFVQKKFSQFLKSNAGIVQNSNSILDLRFVLVMDAKTKVAPSSGGSGDSTQLVAGDKPSSTRPTSTSPFLGIFDGLKRNAVAPMKGAKVQDRVGNAELQNWDSVLLMVAGVQTGTGSNLIDVAPRVKTKATVCVHAEEAATHWKFWMGKKGPKASFTAPTKTVTSDSTGDVDGPSDPLVWRGGTTYYPMERDEILFSDASSSAAAEQPEDVPAVDKVIQAICVDAQDPAQLLFNRLDTDGDGVLSPSDFILQASAVIAAYKKMIDPDTKMGCTPARDVDSFLLHAFAGDTLTLGDYCRTVGFIGMLAAAKDNRCATPTPEAVAEQSSRKLWLSDKGARKACEATALDVKTFLSGVDFVNKNANANAKIANDETLKEQGKVATQLCMLTHGSR
eukprot:g4926.t1